MNANVTTIAHFAEERYFHDLQPVVMEFEAFAKTRWRKH